MRGFSLIELMVSLTIGLIITVAAMSAYMSASGASQMAEAQGRMYEDAQAALLILTQQLRMAGSNPDQANRTDLSRRNPVYLPAPTYSGYTTTFAPSAFAIRGCNGNFSNITDTTATRLDDLTCVPDTTKPDSIGVNYEADLLNTIPTTGNPPTATDCVGNSLSSITVSLPPSSLTTALTATYTVADNRFYIGASSNIPSLFCKGNGGVSPQALVENIEDMHFTYGTMNSTTVAASATTAPVAGYLRADEIVSNTSLAALLDDSARWAKVVTVRICVLVRSERPVVTNAASAGYVKCNGDLDTTQTDLRLRRAFSTTVVLRNRRI